MISFLELFCGPLEAEIINGNYNCTEGAAEGSICMPYCDEGFVISPHGHEGYQCTNATCSHHSGPGEYICRPLEWEGEPTPECVRPRKLLFCNFYATTKHKLLYCIIYGTENSCTPTACFTLTVSSESNLR